MATATSRSPQRPEPASDPASAADQTSIGGRLLHLFDLVYRFLASLKLAVICLGTLALTLAVATKFNSDYGQNAVNDYIYQSRCFALLLGFLGANIFCAAAIRYPWTKRQTGFVITHIGLLVVIGGSWWASQSSDEGQVGLKEGESTSELIRNNKPVLYVKAIDPHSQKELGTYKIPVHPGAFDWKPTDSEVVSRPEDPFKLTVKGFYPSSILKEVVVPNPIGRPMVKLRPTVIPPGSTVASPIFPDPVDAWFPLADDRLGRTIRDAGPAQFIVAKAARPEVFDDFLNPPSDPGIEGVAILHYEDQAGATRRFDVRLDDAKEGVALALPDSDLTAEFNKISHLPIEASEEQSLLGTDSLDLVQFLVQRGDGPEVEHNGYAMLPTIPAIIPRQDDPESSLKTPLVRINYYSPPVIDPKVNRKFGVVEVMVDPMGQMAYRVFERGNPGKLRSHGPIKVGDKITAFGGNNLAPMTLAFEVEDYLKSGRKETVAESFDLPPGQRDNSIPSILAEMTVKGETRDVWLRKSADFEMNFKPVVFGDSVYELAYDVDRLDLGFALKLNDFDVGFDPGTSNASSYRSEVTLTDLAAGIKDEPKSIYMNHTLDHKGWRFFQTSYYPYEDKKTGQKTGEFVSVFQVAKNPAREMIYAGCIIVVLGAFVQFYMRAGLFTDGGKREREQAAAKARRRLEAKSRVGVAPTQTSQPPESKLKPKPGPDEDFEPL